jgi:hypothetical protein
VARKRFSSEFKTKVVKGEKTVAQLSSEYSVMCYDVLIM